MISSNYNKGLREGYFTATLSINGIKNSNGIKYFESIFPDIIEEDDDDFQSINSSIDYTSNKNNNNNKKYWLSWIFFNRTYKSDEFNLINDNDFNIINDKIKLKYYYNNNNKNKLNIDIIKSFPLQIFLCTNQIVRAYTLCDPFLPSTIPHPSSSSSSSSSLSNRKDDKDNEEDEDNEDEDNIEYFNLTFPVNYQQWVPLTPLDNNGLPIQSENGTTFLNISLNIERENDNDDELNENKKDIEDVEEEAIEEEEEEKEIEEEKKEIYEEKEENEDNNEDNEDSLRHFCLNIELKSLKNLKYSNFLSLQYSYPHLGSNGIVKSPPQWYPGGSSEIIIEKSGVKYEFVTTKNRLIDIFNKYLLHINIIQKSSIGNFNLGFSLINLLLTYNNNNIYGYRCPLTSKIFKDINMYNKHRDKMKKDYNNMIINSFPPREPDIIYASDQYYDCISTENEDNIDNNNNNNKLRNLLSSAKLRAVIVLEDKGIVGREMAVRVKPGYSMHEGAIYKKEKEDRSIINSLLHDEDIDDNNSDNEDNSDPEDNNNNKKKKKKNYDKILDNLFNDWEKWRILKENEWRNELLKKEILLKEKLEENNKKILKNKLDDIKKGQIEINKLEIKLKTLIDDLENKKNNLIKQEESLEMKSAQKLQELQLLNKRLRIETKNSIDVEIKKREEIESLLKNVQDINKILEKRLINNEEMIEKLKNKLKNSPEIQLREEISGLKVKLSERYEEIEREKAAKAAVILEREHFRAQLYRLATALKREREKNSILARQELEQLRLEFLAREERYILDGDREALASIKDQLASLRNNVVASSSSPSRGSRISPPTSYPSSSHYEDDDDIPPGPPSSSPYEENRDRVNNNREREVINDSLSSEVEALLSSGSYSQDDPFVQELKRMNTFK